MWWWWWWWWSCVRAWRVYVMWSKQACEFPVWHSHEHTLIDIHINILWGWTGWMHSRMWLVSIFYCIIDNNNWMNWEFVFFFLSHSEDIISFRCAEKKKIPMKINEHWAQLESGLTSFIELFAYFTTTALLLGIIPGQLVWNTRTHIQWQL